jgi:hypothetical protein
LSAQTGANTAMTALSELVLLRKLEERPEWQSEWTVLDPARGTGVDAALKDGGQAQA